MSDLAWAAGLFVGEGSCAPHARRRKDGTGHVYIKLGMYDERGVERFRKAIEPAVLSTPGLVHKYVKLHCRKVVRSGVEKEFYCVDLGGRPALAALRALWPHLSDTHKGDQIMAALDAVSIPREEVTNAR